MLRHAVDDALRALSYTMNALPLHRQCSKYVTFDVVTSSVPAVALFVLTVCCMQVCVEIHEETDVGT